MIGTTFHVSNDGVPRRCFAREGNCPIGGEHFATKKEAEEGFAKTQNTFTRIGKVELVPATPEEIEEKYRQEIEDDMFYESLAALEEERERARAKRPKGRMELKISAKTYEAAEYAKQFTRQLEANGVEVTPTIDPTTGAAVYIYRWNGDDSAANTPMEDLEKRMEYRYAKGWHTLVGPSKRAVTRIIKKHVLSPKIEHDQSGSNDQASARVWTTQQIADTMQRKLNAGE